MRDVAVTGVQTCALPISRETATFVVRSQRAGTSAFLDELRRAVWSVNGNLSLASVQTRSEERRVGKECSSRRPSYYYKKMIDGVLLLTRAAPDDPLMVEL